jgi:hypothetical protein
MDNRRALTPWTVAYRTVVLSALIGGFGYVIHNSTTYIVEQRDAAQKTAWMLDYQAKTLEKLSDRLGGAFDAIGSSNSVVVSKLGEIQHQIDVLGGRVKSLEDRK